MTAGGARHDHHPPVRVESARSRADDRTEANAVRIARQRLRALSQQTLQNRGLTLRRAFLRNGPGEPFLPVAGQLAMAPGGDGTGPGPDGVALRLMLLALWAAGGKSPDDRERFNPKADGRPSHSTFELPTEDLVTFLAMMSSPSTANRRVTDAAAYLRRTASYAAVPDGGGHEMRPATTRQALIGITWDSDPQARGWTVQLLNELGTGGHYEQPATVQELIREHAKDDRKREELRKRVEAVDPEARRWWVDGLDLKEFQVPFEHHYFRLEPEFVTNGWLTVLPTPALHLYLYLQSQVYDEERLRPDIQPTHPYRNKNWVVPSRHTFEHCVRLLCRYGLIEAPKRRYGRRTVYDISLSGTDAYVTRFAPMVRTPKTRMGDAELSDWLKADEQCRMPSDSTLEKLVAQRGRTGG